MRGSTNQQHTGQDLNASRQQQSACTTPGRDTNCTFNQDDVNRLLAGERRTQEQRFADAVSKAAEFDKLAEKDKTDLQKATDRGVRLNRQLRVSRLTEPASGDPRGSVRWMFGIRRD